MLPSEKQLLVNDLNNQFRHHEATHVIDAVLKHRVLGQVAMVSSFGAESAALLHLIAITQPETPFLFIDTNMLFVETLIYQSDLAEQLGLKNLRILRADPTTIAKHDPNNTLHKDTPDTCCHLRKTSVLKDALASFDGWITGRKRYRGNQRAELEFFEYDAPTNKFKINPLVHWRAEDVADYFAANNLPPHPLVAKGYPSIGFKPCTVSVRLNNDVRSGRWQGRAKTECGIHFKTKSLTPAEDMT
jgi:phosphoadenosine phosphosulfate reductase